MTFLTKLYYRQRFCTSGLKTHISKDKDSTVNKTGAKEIQPHAIKEASKVANSDWVDQAYSLLHHINVIDLSIDKRVRD